MGAMASQTTSLAIVYSNVYSGAGQRKLQSSRSLAFVTGIHRWPVHSPHKGPVTRKFVPFDDHFMICVLFRALNKPMPVWPQHTLYRNYFVYPSQPMRDDATLQRRLLLAGPIHEMIPAPRKLCSSKSVKVTFIDLSLCKITKSCSKKILITGNGYVWRPAAFQPLH